MSITLHVWGPAFDLPSVDPQCLAAITYFQQAVPPGEWLLQASSNDAISPTRKLPALQDDDCWVGGLNNIIDHLRTRENRNFDLDQYFNPIEKADIAAFTSHILTYGARLLDAYLFVSSENYIATTRPAYSSLLRWPMTWTVTPIIHAQAKSRTDHLGLSSLDLQYTEDNQAGRPAVGADIVPDSLRSNPQSLLSLVRRPETASRFKLEALADRFLRPLNVLLGKKKYFVSQSSFSSLDCIAYAYLALMLRPQLPQPWVREIVDRRYPNLQTYVASIVTPCLRGSVGVEKAITGDGDGSDEQSYDVKDPPPRLPWRRSESQSLLEKSSSFVTSVISDPLDVPIIQSGTAASKPSPQVTVPLLFGLLGAVTSVGGYLGYAYNEAHGPKQSLSDMGEAGAILSSLEFGTGGGASSIPREGPSHPQQQPNEMVFHRH